MYQWGFQDEAGFHMSSWRYTDREEVSDISSGSEAVKQSNSPIHIKAETRSYTQTHALDP